MFFFEKKLKKMNFLYPYFLFALFSISIPIIIHLFNFRSYKTVYFSNLEFLKNIKQETKAKSELKHLLILISRILMIIFLVFAFAQIYIPSEEEKKIEKEKIISIYIDNSFSMDAEGKDGKLLELAKNKAVKIANAYANNTKFLLITNDFFMGKSTLISKEQCIEMINDVKISASVKNLSEIFSRQEDFISEEKEEIIFVLSDFQKNSNDFLKIKNNDKLKVNLIPLFAKINNNLYIDSCWFETPSRKLNQSEELFVKIVNKSQENYQNIPIKLSFLNLKNNENYKKKSVASFNIEKNSTEIVKLTYTNTEKGILNGKIEISDYPITYDNTFYFSYSIAKNVKILNIFEEKENIYFEALFGKDEYFDIKQEKVSKIKVSEFNNYSLIIIDELKKINSGFLQDLTNYISSGGTILFFPNEEGDIENYNFLLENLQSEKILYLDDKESKIENINIENEIYKNVFKKLENNTNLPDIFKYFVFSHNKINKEQIILSTENNHKILSFTPFGKGGIYVFSIPNKINASNFVKHPIFIPTIYNIALNSQISSKIYYKLGDNENVEIKKKYLNSDFNILHITNSVLNFDFIPEKKVNILNSNILLNVKGKIKEANNYFVKDGKKILYGISFNFNRKESDLIYWDINEIKTLISSKNLKNFKFLEFENIKEFATVLKNISQGKQIWKIFILLSLLFFAIEILLIRIWK